MSITPEPPAVRPQSAHPVQPVHAPLAYPPRSGAHTAPQPAMTLAERTFVNAAHRGNLLIIRAAERAMTHQLPGEVLEFAKKMIAEHQLMGRELTSLSARKGMVLMPLPVPPPAPIHGVPPPAAPGQVGDFLEGQVELHREAVEAYQHAAAELSGDGEVKTFATKHLVHLRVHFDEAERLVTVS